MDTYPDIITRLRSATPQKRIKIIKRLYNKNIGYFAVKHPAISQMLKDVPCPYEINLTEDFLDIIDSRTGEKCHPDIGLDHFAEALGDWTSKGWVDFLSPKLNYADCDWHHCRLLMKFNKQMLEASPEFFSRVGSQAIHLQKTEDGLRFSNPVAFVGIFHGLHIEHYLSHTHVRTAIFLEPEPHRFEVSCYFLDYEKIAEHFDGLLLHVGGDVPADFITTLYRKALISNAVWTRVLGGYASEHIEPIVRQLRMAWASINDEWFPADREINGFKHGLENLQAGRPLLISPITLSSESKIVVVGAGPSLAEDLGWLKENQENLIIFATHTSLRTLKKHKIRPDFQFSLDLETSEQSTRDIQYDFDIPIVVDYKVNPHFLEPFQSIFMISDSDATSCLIFYHTLKDSYPTTGNLTLALACHSQPTELYLIGLDFGFRKLDQTHVSGSIYDDSNLEIKVKGLEQWEITPNFANADPIYTRPYFNTARQQAEQVIKKITSTTRVYNLSDGAKIEGAVPIHSQQCSIPPYSQKKADLAAIKNSFTPASEGVHWRRHPLSGEVLLETFKSSLRGQLHLKKFSWPEFSKSIDSAIWKANQACDKSNANDNRMIPYCRILQDLLLSWYRVMIFTNSVDEAEALYNIGFKHVTDLINDLEWPDGLD